MQIRKGYKYRLKTNRATKAKFVRFAGACRFVWNKILSINEHRYFAGVPCLSYAEACQLLAWWKQSEEYGWLRAVHSQVLQQCLKDLERAYANLFAGRAAPPQYRWDMLPHDLLPKSTVYEYFVQWRDDGTWAKLVKGLRERTRVAAGRAPTPSVVCIDSQSVKPTEMGGPERGYDGGKKINGRKRHLLGARSQIFGQRMK